MTGKRTPRAVLGASATVAALLLAGCGSNNLSDAGAAAQADAGPEILYSGCAEVTREGVCSLIDDAHLLLWLGATDPDACTVSLGQRKLDLASEGDVREDGWSIRVQPAVLPSRLSVACGRGASRRLALELEIDRARTPSWSEAERALTKADRLDDAIRLLDRMLVEHDPAPVLSRRARLHARARNWAASERDLIAAIAAHGQVGSLSPAIRDISTLAYHRLNRVGDVAGAIALLDSAPQAPPGDAASAMMLANTHGLAARTGADLPASERHYRMALRMARRAGSVADIAAAQGGLAQTLAELGRFDLALTTLRAADLDALAEFGTCDRARMRNARAWIALLSNEARGSPHDPLPDLEKAASLLARECSHLDADRANVEVNRALAYVQRVQPGQARAALAAARALTATRNAALQYWILEIEARIALLEGDGTSALRSFEALIERSEAALLLEPQWRGHLGAAHAQRALGDLAAAMRHFEQADRLLRSHGDALPMLGGRASFMARYEQLPRAWIDALLEQGDTEKAWFVARSYRNEPLRQLERALQISAQTPSTKTRWLEIAGRYQRFRAALDAEVATDWALPARELAAVLAARAEQMKTLRALVQEAAALQPSVAGIATRAQPAAGVLGLLYFPGEQDWYGFAHSADGLRAVRIVAPPFDADAQAVASALLEPFRAELAHAGQLRILPYGRLRELDFHRLPLDGRPLSSHLPVVYSADIEAPAVTPAEFPSIALAGDSRGDLPHARSEVESIARIWREARAQAEIELLVGRGVTRDAVVRSLARATTWHFAGHTVYAGASDERALALADGQTFDTADVLLQQRVPDMVFLAACDSAVADADSQFDSVNIAHAFIARGSRYVIASNRLVGDSASAVVATTLHGLHAEGVPLETALAAAQARLREQAPAADWSSFRMYTQ